jgi:cellulose synthase/poly-beta-1,6-N-acetylglucosamine synthase-like glycosyltransferase
MTKLDRIGYISSIVCALHCTVMPLVLIAFPILSLSLFVNETFEWVFLSLSLLLGMTSLCFGYKKHKSFKAFPMLATGLVLIVIGRIMHQHTVHQKEIHIDLYNIILFAGGILVALSHKINSMLCNTCTKCNIK